MPTESFHRILQERRRIASRMFDRGLDAKLIAELVDVHPQTVRAWRRVYDHGGPQALKAKPHLGPRCKLNDVQKQRFLTLIQQPPSHYGYGKELWTTVQMTRLIKDRFNVDYTHNHIGVILHELGYSWQMPAKQARERDEARITAWRQEDWPGIVAESEKRGSTLVFVDEAGFSMIPTIRKQWAVCGRTPVVKHRNRWHRKVSVIGGLTVSGDRQTLGLWMNWHPEGHVKQAEVVGYLRSLVEQHPGPIDVIWDNLSAHGGKEVRAFCQEHPQVHLHRLPPYAPELNPIEGVWSLTKYHRMANHQIDDLNRLHARALAEVADVGEQPRLLRSCIDHAGLSDALWLSGDQ